MLLLCVDSAAVASVAVVKTSSPGVNEPARVMAQWDTQDTKSHAEVLTPAVERVIADAGVSAQQLDCIVVGTGPGPFTGLRAGLVTAQALGFVWGIPVYGLCSLDALAHEVACLPAEQRPRDFVVATDARRKEVYWALYCCVENDGSPYAVAMSAPAVGRAAELPRLPAYGYGAGLYAQDLKFSLPTLAGAITEPGQWQPKAAALGLAASAVLDSGGSLSTDITPLYLRESDAKVPAQRKKATS